MLNKLLNAKGITILSKEEQRNIHGGLGGNCRITLTSSSGARLVQNLNLTPGLAPGPSDSEAANSYCVGAIESGWSRCQYNCSWDD